MVAANRAPSLLMTTGPPVGLAVPHTLVRTPTATQTDNGCFTQLYSTPAGGVATRQDDARGKRTSKRAPPPSRLDAVMVPP